MCYRSTNLQNAAARTVTKLIVLLYHYNSNISTFKFYSVTTEPQQKASADDNNGAAQLVGNGFSMAAVIVEEYEAPAGFGSFEDDAPFGSGADKPTSTAESHLPPSSSTVHGVEEEDYAGNTSASMDK